MAVDNLIESSLANLFIDTPLCYLIISLNASFCENSLLSIVSAHGIHAGAFRATGSNQLHVLCG